MPDYQRKNKTIAKNALYLYIRMFLVLFINLYTSRVLLKTLGVSDYGIYVVVASIITLFSVLNTSLSATMQRYFNYVGANENIKEINIIFSSGIYIHAFIAIITIVVLETIGLWYVNHFIVIPLERMQSTIFLFHISTFSLFFVILQIPLTSLILARERMSIYSLISIIDVMLKLITTLLLPYVEKDHLKVYGVMLFGIVAIDFLLYIICTKRVFPSLNFLPKIYKEIIKELFLFTGWNLMGTFAFMLKAHGLSLLLNNFFGTILNAARGIALQISSAVGNFSSNISIAFSPQIVNRVAVGDNHKAKSMMFQESKICFALILIVVIPLCLEIDNILKLWLGNNVPPNTNIFTILVLVDTLICTLNTPCTQITQATGKIRKYQTASTFVNLSLIPTCYLFLKLGYPPVSTFFITIVFSIINQIVCLIYTNKAFGFKLSNYMIKVIYPCILVIIFIGIVPFTIRYNMQASWVRMFCIFLSTALISIPTYYHILMEKDERKLFNCYVRKKISNTIKYGK